MTALQVGDIMSIMHMSHGNLKLGRMLAHRTTFSSSLSLFQMCFSVTLQYNQKLAFPLSLMNCPFHRCCSRCHHCYTASPGVVYAAVHVEWRMAMTALALLPLPCPPHPHNPPSPTLPPPSPWVLPAAVHPQGGCGPGKWASAGGLACPSCALCCPGLWRQHGPSQISLPSESPSAPNCCSC